MPLPTASTSLTPQALGLSGLPIQQPMVSQNFQVASENANLSSLLSQALSTGASAVPKPIAVSPATPRTQTQTQMLLHQHLVQKINQKPNAPLTPTSPNPALNPPPMQHINMGQTSLPLPLAVPAKSVSQLPKAPEVKPPDHKPVASNNPLINALNMQNAQIPDNLFEQSNALSESDKHEIVQFLTGPRNNPTSDPAKQFLLHQEIKSNPQNSANVLEQLVFEINYQVGTWRKLRRKKNLLPSQVAEYTAVGVPVIQVAATPVPTTPTIAPVASPATPQIHTAPLQTNGQ